MRTPVGRRYTVVPEGYCGKQLRISGARHQGDPRLRPSRIGPRAFKISVVKSFGGSLVSGQRVLAYYRLPQWDQTICTPPPYAFVADVWALRTSGGTSRFDQNLMPLVSALKSLQTMGAIRSAKS